MPWNLHDMQKLPHIVGQRYDKAQVLLDGVSHEGCIFDHCHLVYRGGPGRVVSCQIGSGCVWEFQDAAAFVMQMLTDLGWKLIPPAELDKLQTGKL